MLLIRRLSYPPLYMKLNIVSIIISLLTLGILLFITFFNKPSSSDVVFVRSQVVFEQYDGMKEAMRVFQEKKASWQSNLDTLNADYQKAISAYNLESIKLPDSEKIAREEVLKRQYQNVSKYAQMLEEKAGDEDQMLTQGVLNQIDEFIKEYAQKKGYKIVMGTTNSGNVLYGDESLDITDELLDALNKNYHK